jgi:hypothetical protein
MAMPGPEVKPEHANYLIALTLSASPMRPDTACSPSGAGRLASVGLLAAE